MPSDTHPQNGVDDLSPHDSDTGDPETKGESVPSGCPGAGDPEVFGSDPEASNSRCGRGAAGFLLVGVASWLVTGLLQPG